MKALIVYYSRTGNTEKIAKEISGNLKVDIDEIIDMTNRKGIIGWLRGGRDAMKNILTEIKNKKNPLRYDLVIIGTPIWAGTLCPAVRTYLSKNKFKKIAFFCTFGGNPGKSFEEMEKLSKKPVAKLGIKDTDIKKGTYKGLLNDFLKKIR